MDTVRHNRRPGPWGLPVELDNGIRVLLRPIAPGDKAALHVGMSNLSSAARRQRFFCAKEELDENTVIYLTEIDYRSHFAWVAVDLDREGQPVVAVARYIALAEDPATAEVAFVVGDDYQGHGLCTMLLDLLTVVARDNGIERFYARVLVDNATMRHILTRAGARLEPDDAGVLQTTFDLPPLTGRFSPATVVSVARATADRESHRRPA